MLLSNLMMLHSFLRLRGAHAFLDSPPPTLSHAMHCQPKRTRLRQTMIATICVRMLLISVGAISLAGCTFIDGTVSTAYYSAPPLPPMFIVISPDSLSLTERNISALIEAKLTERGLRKATSFEAANIGVLYKYSIDPLGRTYNIPGSPIFNTTYPRHFMIAMIDLRKSKMPEKVEYLWQAELYSEGSSRDISSLAPIFIEELFLSYGKSVTNKSFSLVQ